MRAPDDEERQGPRGLKAWAGTLTTLDLERLKAVVGTRRLGFPLSRLALQAEGLERLTGEVAALNALGREGTLVLLDAVLMERRAEA